MAAVTYANLNADINQQLQRALAAAGGGAGGGLPGGLLLPGPAGGAATGSAAPPALAPSVATAPPTQRAIVAAAPAAAAAPAGNPGELALANQQSAYENELPVRKRKRALLDIANGIDVSGAAAVSSLSTLQSIQLEQSIKRNQKVLMDNQARQIAEGRVQVQQLQARIAQLQTQVGTDSKIVQDLRQELARVTAENQGVEAETQAMANKINHNILAIGAGDFPSLLTAQLTYSLINSMNRFCGSANSGPVCQVTPELINGFYNQLIKQATIANDSPTLIVVQQIRDDLVKLVLKMTTDNVSGTSYAQQFQIANVPESKESLIARIKSTIARAIAQ